MSAIRDARRAKWQGKVADAMQSFEVGGIDATHDEMLRKVEEQTAVNEARMQMALESVDTQSMKIEEDAEALQACGGAALRSIGDPLEDDVSQPDHNPAKPRIFL